MDLREYVHMLGRRWRIIAIVLLCVLGINVILTARADPVYQSQTRLFVSTPDLLRTEPLQAGSFAIQRVSTYVDLANGDELASRVVNKLKLRTSPSSFASKVSAVAVPETVIMVISTTDANPRLAQEYSQVAAEQLIELVAEIESPAGKGTPAVKVTVASPAKLPTSPISPRPVRNFGLALLVGLLLGLGAANVREQLDPRSERDGARQMLAAALPAEVAGYVDAHADQLDEADRRLLVRDGHNGKREVTTAAGAVPAPRVNDKRTEAASGPRKRFSSAILPAWSRKSPQVAEVLPLLYLHGLSTSDFGPALEQFLGKGSELSAATINRLTTEWLLEALTFNARSLAETDYVYMWVDGIHLKVRLSQDKACLLVMIGVRTDGRQELIALADGHRKSTESWADLLSSCRRRGMAAPVLAVGDGALGFWAAVREVFPETREQRCWFHKMANVLNALPESAHPGAKAALVEIYNAEDKEHAHAAVKAFEDDYGAKWPKAVAKITEDLDVLLEFYDYPAEHWVHLRTTNPIESTFATVRLRQRVTKKPGSRAAGIAMAFKLIESAEQRWRALNAPHLVALVRAGARFEKGELVERSDDSAGDKQVT